MISPAAMFIEMGAAGMQKTPEFVAQSQSHELRVFGDERARALGASGLSPDFQMGYALGLATARALLACSVPIALAGVKAEDLL